MIGSIAWTWISQDPARDDTETDRHVREEYGGPNAAWLLRQRDDAPAPEPVREDGPSESLLRRITQALTAFF